MRRIAAILFLLINIASLAFAQGEIDDEEKIFYRNERTYGAYLNSHGVGFGFRYARRIDAFRKTVYDFDFSYIKHQKERRIPASAIQQNWNTFIYGKLNSLYTVRAGIGIQKELFRKEDKGGISIRYFYCLGPSIGIQKPIYYNITTDGVTNQKQFETHYSINDIEGKAPFYVGFKEITVVPGVYAKFGFSFEFSKRDEDFRAIEAGITTDAYLREIPIMANDLNKWIYPAFFISYRFGKVIDAQFKSGPNKLERALSD